MTKAPDENQPRPGFLAHALTPLDSTRLDSAQAFFGEGTIQELRDGDGNDVSVTAVAAAAFAGGWFCALLAVITMACWSELSTEGEGEGGPWPAGFGAWVVRAFADP